MSEEIPYSFPKLINGVLSGDKYRQDSLHCLSRVLMFPDSYYRPAHFVQFKCLPTIPCSGFRHFLFPPSAVRERELEVFWASVPETAVYEYTNPFRGEHEVSSHSNLRDGTCASAQLKTSQQKFLSYALLGLSFGLANGSHETADSWRTSVRRTSPDGPSLPHSDSSASVATFDCLGTECSTAPTLNTTASACIESVRSGICAGVDWSMVAKGKRT